MKKSVIISLAFALALIMIIGSVAYAESLPSSKWAWAFDDIIGLSFSADTDTGSTPPASGETLWVNVLRTFIKMPNDKELAIGVSLQCGIVTDTTVKSVSGNQDTSEARATVKVRVKITKPDGGVVYAQPSNSADALFTQVDGLVYCDRIQRLEAKFAGLGCTANLSTGAVTCTTPEELRLLLRTMNANHFNFLAANMSLSGVYKIEVQAKAKAGVVLGGSTLGAAKAEAFVGAGALSVETIRLVKDADGTPALQ